MIIRKSYLCLSKEEQSDSMISIIDAVKDGARKLKVSGVESPDYDSFELLSDIMGISRTDYLIRGKEPVPEDLYQMYESAIERRCNHEPLQHILGKAWFYGREYVVNNQVLVPRFDTEIVVEKALGVIDDGMSVLDMCTGSGCIIITLALERLLKRAVGVDLSTGALEVAKTNVKKLGATVDIVQGDLFSALDDNNDKFDVIVSNPPYIETAVIESLSEEVRLFDPLMALDGFEDGLHFYRCITEESRKFLNKSGWLVYEIGYNQGLAVSEIMEHAGFEDVKVYKDYAGLDRVVMGKIM